MTDIYNFPGVLFFWIFWFSLGILFYAYFGYGLLLMLLIKLRKGHSTKKSEDDEPFLPQVTILVPCFNEGNILREKIQDILLIDYPEHLLDIVFITDGSSDNSENILKGYSRIRHFHQPVRKGKTAAINRAFPLISSPFIILCDANTSLNKESVRLMVRHFRNPRVGGVAGEKKIRKNVQDAAAGAGEGIYWRYESFLKTLDSDFYTIVGAAGELFAIRRELFERLPEDSIIEDFILSLKICQKNYLVKYEPAAIASESSSPSIRAEYIRKTRIAAGAFQAMWRLRTLFNPLQHPLVSFQFISHRVLRWTFCPPALLMIFISNLFLVAGSASYFYIIIMILQILFYLLALSGWLMAERGLKFRVFFIPFYFVFMNYSIIAGFLRYISGKQTVLWEKAERSI